MTLIKTWSKKKKVEAVSVIALIGHGLHDIGANVFNWSQKSNISKCRQTAKITSDVVWHAHRVGRAERAPPEYFFS